MRSTELRKNAYENDITRYLDEHLIKCEDCWPGYKNVLIKNTLNGDWIIRVPGATRGHVKVDNGVVSEIKLYDYKFCYRKSVYEKLDSFIGVSIDLK